MFTATCHYYHFLPTTLPSNFFFFYQTFAAPLFLLPGTDHVYVTCHAADPHLTLPHICYCYNGLALYGDSFSFFLFFLSSFGGRRKEAPLVSRDIFVIMWHGTTHTHTLFGRSESFLCNVYGQDGISAYISSISLQCVCNGHICFINAFYYYFVICIYILFVEPSLMVVNVWWCLFIWFLFRGCSAGCCAATAAPCM